MNKEFQLPNTPACGLHCIKIKDFGVKTYVIGEGNKIINQYPAKGQVITTKDLIILITNDNINRKIPDFTGLSINQSKTLLSYLDINYELEGNGYVVSQSIEKGTIIDKDMTLKLVFSDYYVKEENKKE